MNANRRKRIAALLTQLEPIVTEVEALQQEEQEAVDAMPGNLRETERGQSAEQAANTLDDAVSSATELVSNLENAADDR